MPLPIIVKTQAAYCGFIVIVMAVYWCTDVIPLAVTALMPALFFPLFGILQSKKVCMQYLKDANMLFLGGLMVALAIEHWNLHKRFALKALLLVGIKPALLMLGFMGVTAFLSMWISNTATTAMMIPIAQAVLDQLNSTEMKEDRKNLEHQPVTNDMELQEEGISNKIDASAPISLSVDQRNDAGSSVNESILMASSSSKDDSEQKNIRKGLTLCVCYAASIGGTATLTGTGPNLVLKGQFNELFPENGDVINFASWFGFSFPNMLFMLFFSWIWLQILFLGVNFRKMWGWRIPISQKEKRAIGVLQTEYNKLGAMSFAEIAVLIHFTLLVILWFTRDPGFIRGWGSILFDKGGKRYVSDATVVLAIAFVLFLIPSKRPHFSPWARVQQNSDSPSAEQQTKSSIPRLLEWNLVQRKLPWSVVLLLGGGFALAKGCEVSGLSKWLGLQLIALQYLPKWAIAFVLCLVIAVFTECTSNVATATLFLPILASMASIIRINPLYVMIPTTLSTSFAFMLPVATPPNAIAFSYGNLKITDMVKAGSILNVIGVVSVTIAINTWGQAMFQLNHFPEWANNTNGRVGDFTL
uniref:Na(+)/citrate cotransporter-like n=1 Tax=Pristiophorus japonicus TaxID=55135 RepID=UPI00398EF926